MAAVSDRADAGFGREKGASGFIPVALVPPCAIAEKLEAIDPRDITGTRDDVRMPVPDFHAGHFRRVGADGKQPSGSEAGLDPALPAARASGFEHAVKLIPGKPVVVHTHDLIDIPLVEPERSILKNHVIAIPASPVVAPDGGR